ncbi:hypothetical protein G4Y79_13990 [Phototrophicus methaneseepsis]|uniref:STAS/SEC14 domain-containing protein n=1 Tax=Phototrophicus methaneseepsis TaxID=2710758 RepID=A0A7S8ICZ3_9CHLR|nr:hypothetical protein [Phototrophicus methaneseepsis]QPC80819.1 hypothetical protein G4Y79_13990 [Phototrophicus methaneseepsis]
MAFEVEWLDKEQLILRIRFIDHVSWSEFYDSIHYAHNVVLHAHHRVNLVIEDQAGLPDGNSLMHFRTAMANQPTNLKQVFIIPKTEPNQTIKLALMKRFSSILQNIMPSKSSIIFVTSLAEVYRYIDKAHAT